jgi:hypothetical protein
MERWKGQSFLEQGRQLDQLVISRALYATDEYENRKQTPPCIGAGASDGK